MRIRFWRWTGLFAAAGLLFPLCFCVHWFVFHGELSSMELLLWPSSILLMGLGPGPEPTSTLVIAYLIVILENMVLYAAVGAALWWCVNGVLRGVATMRAKAR